MRELTVLEAGALTTVQDLGRPGHAHLGVPHSGALDAPALRLANRLVGNPEGSAALETTLTGVRVRLGDAVSLAVTGATCDVRVDGQPVAHSSAVSAPAGAVVALGPALSGLRSYLAVAGGVDVAPVLGSRSTDVLTGLGPAPLAQGEVLRVGGRPGRPGSPEGLPRATGSVLHLDLGPRSDWFTESSVRALDGSAYVVGAASNRIGLRLEGMPLERSREGELESEGMVLGAVQVPPSGQPIVFLNDHPTTGGYPVVGVVRSADLAVCAQARPGDRLTLRVVG